MPMKRSKKIFQLVEKRSGDVFWNGVFVTPLGQRRVETKNIEYNTTSDIQTLLTITKTTTKGFNIDDRLTVDNIFNSVDFHDKPTERGYKSARTKELEDDFLKSIEKSRNLLFSLPPVEDEECFEEEAEDLQGQGVKFLIPPIMFNI